MTTHTGPGWTLYQGDCLDVLPTLAAGSAAFAFVDPPYNVGKDYGDYDDSQPLEQYLAWCAEWLGHLKRITGGRVAIYPPKIHLLAFWNMIPENHQIVCGWSPEGAIRGGFVHQYIPLLVPPQPVERTKDHWWNVQVPGLGYFYREQLFGHPGQTSLDITRRVIRAFTKPGDTVIDCFLGTGTTGVVCAQTGRRFIGVERNPGYYAIAKRRIETAQPPLFVADDPAHVAPEQAAMFDGA